MAEREVVPYQEPLVGEDLSYSDLDTFPEFLMERCCDINSLLLDHNQITVLPRNIGAFTNLISLDISNNSMSYLSPEITQLAKLKTLTAKNNLLNNDSLPKDLTGMVNLQVINLSGNQLTEFPMQFTEMPLLRCLYLGGNVIANVPGDIQNLIRLEILYLGGNKLTEIPAEMGKLLRLNALILCDNQLQSLPPTLKYLRNLESLSLHNNRLSTLPPEIIKLRLSELSLRNNPLVVRFIEEMVYEPPSLLELAGRVVKVKHIPYTRRDLPYNLVEYLDHAMHCVNPKCKGVYFTSRVEHIKFVDFCGKYRLPLLEYLCSPHCRRAPICTGSSDSETDEEMPMSTKMKKVLLG